MKQFLKVLFVICMSMILCGCSNQIEFNHDSQSNADLESNNNDKSLLVYFAYSENVGDTTYIEPDLLTSASIGTTSNTMGNIQVITEVIEEMVNVETYSIIANEPYEFGYSDMHGRAINEIRNDILPPIDISIENIEEYDTIFIGTPVWSSSFPAPVLTFINQYDLSKMNIVLYSIHLGSGLGVMENQIKDIYPESNYLTHFTINASTSNNEVRDEVRGWLISILN